MLSILGTIILWTVGLVLALVLVALTVPFHLQAGGAADDDRLEVRVRMRWGWWLLVVRADSAAGIDARVLGIRVWRFIFGRSKDKVHDGGKRSKPKAKKRRVRRGASVLAHRDGLFRLLRALLRAIPVKGEVVGVVGLSDPANTALLFGVIDPLADRYRSIDIDVVPDWVDETVALEGEVTVRVWPLAILAALTWRLLIDSQARGSVRAML